MKKLLILTTSALILGGVLTSAAPAFAQPSVAPVPTIAEGTTIENAGAFTLTFDQANVPGGFCVGIHIAGLPEITAEAQSTLAFSPAVAGQVGLFFVNMNLTSAPVTNTIDVYSVATGCSDPRTLVSSLAWTVNPRMVVATPADVTAGTESTQTVPVTVHDFFAGDNALDLTDGAHWEVVPGVACEGELFPLAVTAPTYVALPAGVTVNPAVSAAGTFPELTLAGTPAADAVGTYNLCLNLVSASGSPSVGYATTTLTVLPAVPAVPALANTGLDSSNLVAGGTGVLGFGVLLIALLRRRKATV